MQRYETVITPEQQTATRWRSWIQNFELGRALKSSPERPRGDSVLRLRQTLAHAAAHDASTFELRNAELRQREQTQGLRAAVKEKVHHEHDQKQDAGR